VTAETSHASASKQSRRTRRRRGRRRKLNGRQILILVAGWAFVVLGVLGLFLPILQGVLFLLIGLFLLSKESAQARWFRQWLRRRYPRLGKGLDQARHRSHAFMQKYFRGRSAQDQKKP
jgi:hypothetical protein